LEVDMGVAALVLGILAVFLAFFGGIGGVVLGIAAVLLGVLGRRVAEREGLPTGSATGGLVTGIIAIVLGGLVFAACLKCVGGCAEVARGFAHIGEAKTTTEAIFRLEEAYYETEHVDSQGNLLPKEFISAGPTPKTVPCTNRPVRVTAEDWRAGGWDRLQFSDPNETTRFQFEAVASGSGKDARVSVIIRTDPNCKGMPAELRETMVIDAEGRPHLEASPFGAAPASRPSRPVRHGSKARGTREARPSHNEAGAPASRAARHEDESPAPTP
jgi:hypothetical protein